MPSLAARWAATRTMTRPTLSLAVASSAALRMSLRTIRIVVRRAHHPASRLPCQHDQAQADRRAFRLDEDGGRLAQDPPLWSPLGGVVPHSDGDCLQSGSNPEADGSNGMTLSGVTKMSQHF